MSFDQLNQEYQENQSRISSLLEQFSNDLAEYRSEFCGEYQHEGHNLRVPSLVASIILSLLALGSYLV